MQGNFPTGLSRAKAHWVFISPEIFIQVSMACRFDLPDWNMDLMTMLKKEAWWYMAQITLVKIIRDRWEEVSVVRQFPINMRPGSLLSLKKEPVYLFIIPQKNI